MKYPVCDLIIFIIRNFYSDAPRCVINILHAKSARQFSAVTKIIFFKAALVLLLLSVVTAITAQKLQFSYSYINLSRTNAGGTLEQGDTIEVHALVKVNSTTNNFYYIDTIR